MANDGRGPGAKNREIKRQRQAAYAQALREGRVVKVTFPTNPTMPNSQHIEFQVCASEAAAFDRMIAAQQNGLEAEILEA